MHILVPNSQFDMQVLLNYILSSGVTHSANTSNQI
jgi:hypothetical protein